MRGFICFVHEKYCLLVGILKMTLIQFKFEKNTHICYYKYA